jgi:hypothetical protein
MKELSLTRRKRIDARAAQLIAEELTLQKLTASDGRGSMLVAPVINGLMEPRRSGAVMPGTFSSSC